MKKLVKKISKSNVKKRDINYVAVLLEEMREKIDVIGEGQTNMREEMSRRFDGVEERLDGHDDNFKIIIDRLKRHDEKIDAIEKHLVGHDANFKVSLEYLSRIDDEINEIKSEIKEAKKSGKADEGWVASIEKRIGFIEKQLKLQKQMAR